jgi:hypothetical protein
MPINQTHIQISQAGNETITMPNSTEIVKTKGTGNAIVRLIATGEIVQGRIHMNIEDIEVKMELSTQITQM